MWENKKNNYIQIIKTTLIEVLISAMSILLFATGMYFLEDGYKYSPLIATICIAIGCFAASLYLGNSVGKKGILIGLLVGGITFIIITLVTLFVNDGAVSMHILLRLIILLLTSMIGAIIGVNKKADVKYI